MSLPVPVFKRIKEKVINITKAVNSGKVRYSLNKISSVIELTLFVVKLLSDVSHALSGWWLQILVHFIQKPIIVFEKHNPLCSQRFSKCFEFLQINTTHRHVRNVSSHYHSAMCHLYAFNDHLPSNIADFCQSRVASVFTFYLIFC